MSTIDGIGSVVFAHKTTEGWEALLSGMIKAAGLSPASWPIATETRAPLAPESPPHLATSVHLVCRPRAEDAEIGDWAEIFQELPNRIGDWMERLSAEGVRGADLVFACIGPAMEVYSRYSKVEDAEGREIPLGGDPEASEPHKRGFLAYVWEIVGRIALGQVLGTAEARARNGAAGALEEDSRLTALFLWTIQSPATNGSESERPMRKARADDDEEDAAGKAKKGLDPDLRRGAPLLAAARNPSRQLGKRIIETKKGIVRLLPDQRTRRAASGRGRRVGHADLIERSRAGTSTTSSHSRARSTERPPKPQTEGSQKPDVARLPMKPPRSQQGTTTLDRVHIAMLLQAAGKSNALRTMLKAEFERGQDFLRLANALSALYPKDSEEKRLLDAMLLAVPR